MVTALGDTLHAMKVAHYNTPPTPQPAGPHTCCVVTETYPPEVNGVAMTLERLTRGLLARGHQVQLVLPQRDDRVIADAASMTVATVPGLPLPGYPAMRFGLPWIGELRRTWTRQRPDVIYVATQGPLGWAVLREAKRWKIPVVSGFHTNFHDYSKHYRIGWLESSVVHYLRYFHHQTRYTLVPTPDMSRRVSKLGIGNARVLGRGVDTELFDPRRRSALLRGYWGADETAPVMMYVGRLAAEKNLDLVVRAARQAMTVEPQARMVFVGEGPEERRLRRENPDFTFCGAQRGEVLGTHYASGDVFLFPSLTETFGNVILEAMASGLAVVAYDTAAANLHIRSGATGVTVEPDDETGFCNCAAALVADRKFRHALGLAARRHAEQHGWAGIVAAFESLLCSVVAA